MVHQFNLLHLISICVLLLYGTSVSKGSKKEYDQLSCGKDFVLKENKCYRSLEKSTRDVWTIAHKTCLSLGGNLATLKDKKYLKVETEKTPVWLGMRCQSDDIDSCKWSNGDSISDDDIKNITKSEVNSLLSCLAFRATRKIVWMSCASRLKFVCVSEKWQYGGACPHGYEPVGESCFAIFGKVYQRINISKHNDKCKELNGTLARIKDAYQHSALVALIKSRAAVNLHLNISNNYVDNLQKQHPSLFVSSKGQCYQIHGNTSVVPGLIAPCTTNDRLGYVCMSDRVESERLSAQDQQRIAFSGQWLNRSCPDGFVSYENGEVCYKLAKSQKSHKDAKRSCKQEEGDLLNIADDFEYAVAHLQRLNLNYTSDMWIGLSDTMKYFHEPPESGSGVDGKCRAMTWNGTVTKVSCTDTRHFLCAHRRGTDTTTEPLTQHKHNKKALNCNKEKIRMKENSFYAAEFNDACYYFSKNPSNYEESNKKCKNLGKTYKNAILVNFTSERETSFLVHWLLGIFKENQTLRVWHGDGGDVIFNETYQNWESGSIQSNDKCFSVDANGQWKNQNCSESLKSICRIIAKSKSESEKGLNSLVMGLITGMAVVVFLFVIFCVTAGIYCYRKRSVQSPPAINTPSPNDAANNGVSLGVIEQVPALPPKSDYGANVIEDEGIMEEVYEDMDSPLPPSVQSPVY